MLEKRLQYRFVGTTEKFSLVNHTLFQPIENPDLEIAKGLLGKIMKSKISKVHIAFTELEDFPDLGIMLRSITRQYELKEVLNMFELVED